MQEIYALIRHMASKIEGLENKAVEVDSKVAETNNKMADEIAYLKNKDDELANNMKRALSGKRDK